MLGNLPEWLCLNHALGEAGGAVLAWELLVRVVEVASLILSVLTYLRGLRRKSLSWAVRSRLAIDGEAFPESDLEVRYRGRAVRSLAITNVLLWNSGCEPIEGKDVDGGRLRIILNQGGELLGARILRDRNLPFPSFSLSSGTSSATVHFSHLDRGEGTVVQLVHSTSPETQVVVDGFVSGSGRARMGRLRRVDGSVALPGIGAVPMSLVVALGVGIGWLLVVTWIRAAGFAPALDVLLLLAYAGLVIVTVPPLFQCSISRSLYERFVDHPSSVRSYGGH